MPDLHDNGPFCCGKASWWSPTKKAFVCSHCTKMFPEKLTACKDCKHLLLNMQGHVQRCGAEAADGERFDSFTGTVFHMYSPLTALVNTDGHCGHVKPKPPNTKETEK